MRKIFQLIIVLLFSFSVEAASLPKYGGAITIGLRYLPQTIDPAKASSISEKEICSKIYNTLPQLSKSWSSFKDGLTWVFYLLPGQQFHNYEPLTARDIKFSWERVVAPETNSPYAYIFNAIQGVEEYRSGQESEISGIKVVDTDTLEINLRYLDNSFFENISLCAASILPREEIIDAENDFWSHPVGSGPFRFVSWDQEVILEANEDYLEGRPFLDEIRFTVVPQEAIKNSIEKGDIDIAYLSPDNFDVFSEDETKKEGILLTPEVTTVFLGVNCQNQLLEEIPVREAVSLAIDRERLKELFSSAFRISNLGLPPGLLKLSEKEVAYNPYEAYDILNKEEYLEFKDEPLILYVPDEPKELVKIAREIQDELESVDLNIQLLIKPRYEFFVQLYEEEPDLFLYSWTAENSEPKNFYAYIFSKLLPYTYYQNDELLTLFHLAEQSGNIDEATRFYQEVENLMMREKPFIFLGHLSHSVIYNHPKILNIKKELTKLNLNSSWISPSHQ